MSAVHDLVQGSPEWEAFRLDRHGASEAAAMLGLSPYMTRTELLKMKKLGIPREFSKFVQERVLDRGHQTEALARPIVEKIIGQDLYAATCSLGKLSASCDGLTIDDSIAMEHKQYSEALFAAVSAGEVPEHHMPQCQQVLMVTGASELLFVVSDGTENCLTYAKVYPDEAWFQRLRDGWVQFDRDLAAYVLPEAGEPAPVGKAPDTLPALRIEVSGQVTASNLAEFRETALAAIRSVNRELRTDQDFADADKAVKWCSDVESRLAAAKEHALSQTASIDALFKTIDDISAEARRVRMDLDKLVTRRKTEVKEEAVARARGALDQHIAALNAEIAPMRLQPVPADFAGAIKGKRSLDSMQDALDTTLAAAKIAADGQARGIRANVATLQHAADGLEFLFADLGQIVHKAADDFAALVQARIAAHRAVEAKREADRQAAEAARIAEQQRREEAAQVPAWPQVATPEGDRGPVNVAGPAHLAPKPAPGLEFDHRGVLVPTPAPRADDPATLKLGVICERLGFTVSAAFLADVLHIAPANTEGASKLYTESQYQTLCRQLIAHVGAMAEMYGAEVAA